MLYIFISSRVPCNVLILIILSCIVSGGCEKIKSGAEIPIEQIPLVEIKYFNLFHLQQTQIGCSVYIKAIGGITVEAKGFCWSKFIHPTINDNKTMNGSGAGSFKTYITGLSAATSYYVRAYAISNQDTVYGEEKIFTTLVQEDMKGNFTDSRDGKEYNWIRIGTQIWIVQDMAYLPYVSPPDEGSVSRPYYYVYDYYGTDVEKARNTVYYTANGVYYNWAAAMQGAPGSDKDPSGIRGVCPVGWHLPSDAEWQKLYNYVKNDGYYDEVGAVLKSQNGWVSDSGNGTDEYGFSANPTGGRAEEMGGKFGSLGINAHWWSCTDDNTPNGWMWDITIQMTHKNIINGYATNKSFAFSVRCVSDNNLPAAIISAPKRIQN